MGLIYIVVLYGVAVVVLSFVGDTCVTLTSLQSVFTTAFSIAEAMSPGFDLASASNVSGKINFSFTIMASVVMNVGRYNLL